MEQMATSPLSNGDRTPKSSNRQQGPPVIAQGSQTQPPLNCPRCDSTNTKFCYFNNYSQTQPRHFCKSCRRYWTQGGTLRNVPIGGGCRKNKRVRPRSLLGMGGLDHGSAFTDTTSNMLGRLSSISSFGNGCEDTGSQLLNVAFARFQESMRVRQQAVQSAEGAPFPDMSLPALVHKPCGVSSCTSTACSNRASLHIDGTGCGGLRVDSFDNNLGFHALQAPETGYHPSNFEMTNSALYAHTHNMMGTSATATLASIEDELSSFSNFQYHLNPLSTEVSQEDKVFSLSACSASQRLLARPPLTEHGGSHLSYIESSLMGANADLSEALAEDEKPIKEEIKPIVSMHGENTLSLMMPADNNWQQQHQSPMSEILYSEPHHGMMWSANTSRWPDMHTASVP